MSTEVSRDLVTVLVDGKEIKAQKGDLLIAAAEDAGIFIPRFCYHPRLPQVGMCRMCLVEVKGPRGFSLQPSCYVPVADGMEVITESEKVKKAQDGVLEFLLINHPLDCPVCDKGGECPLQDQTLAYGPGESRFIEEKRHFEKPIAISELVYLDRERCIQCDRCTRFADIVAGDPLIEFIGRGDNTEVNIFPETPFSSYFSGNTVQICPVGALTATPYRFKARPWDLSQVESSCNTCSMGCRIMVQSSQNEVTRYLGLDSEAVNHGWLCDKGRFGHESLASAERVTSPMIRKGDGYVETSWAEAYSLIAAKIKEVQGSLGSSGIAFITGSRLTNEDIYAWVKLAKGVIGTNSIDSQLGDGIRSDVIAQLNRATIDEAVTAKVIVAFTGDIKEEIPVLFLRLRDAVRNRKTKIISVATRSNSLDGISELVVRPTYDQVKLLAKNIIADSSEFQNVSDLINTQGVGADGEGLVILLGRENLAWDQSIVEAFALEISRVAPKAKFLVTLRASNFSGGIDMGASPALLPGRLPLSQPSVELTNRWKTIPSEDGLGVAGMFDGALSDEIGLMFLVGSDPRADFIDTKLAGVALDRVGFVVSIDTFMSESASKADLVLPAAAFAEKSGTTTNLEGRILTLNQKVTAPGLCRSDWVIASEIALELGEDLGFESTADVLDEISQVSPLHWGISFERLTRSNALEGAVVPISATTLTIRPKHRFDQISIPGVVSVWNQGLASSKTTFTEGRPIVAQATEDGNQRAARSDFDTKIEWPLPPLKPYGYMELVYSPKLYSLGEHLKNSPHLSHLIVEARCAMSEVSAKEIGVDTSQYVRVSDRTGGSSMFELKIDDSLSDGVIELIKGVGTSASFSPITSGELINYVKVEHA